MTVTDGSKLLLIWLASEVRWDKDAGEIAYTSSSVVGAAAITVRDGDTITVGGESMQQDSVPVDRNLVWLATPQPTCAGEPWAVNSLAKS